MRFMLLVLGAHPVQGAAFGRFDQELQRAGVLLALDGLHPPSTAARVSFRSGEPRVVDGPFPEAAGAVGGYWLIDVKSREEALQWAKRCPVSEDAVIEVRQVLEP